MTVTCGSVSWSRPLANPLLERRMGGVSSGRRRDSCLLTVMVTVAAAAERRRLSGLSRGGVNTWPRPSSSSLGLKCPVTGGELRSSTPPLP